jgi:hypothetical protein
MEWLSYLAGELHTDKPACVDPILRRFAIALNDNLDDEDRQRLRPYLARCIGTAGDGRSNERLRLLREALRGLTRTYPRLTTELDLAGWVASELAIRGRVDEALDLFDRMLPKELIRVPVAEDADRVCALR